MNRLDPEFRSAIIRLQAADPDDLVKLAGAWDWIRRLFRRRDPEVEAAVTDAEEGGKRVKDLTKDLASTSKEFDTATRNMDTTGMREATQRASQIAAEITQESRRAEEAAQKIEARVTGRTHYTAEEYESEDIRREVLQELPPEVIELVGKTGVQLSQTKHFQTYGPRDVDITDEVYNRILNEVKRVLMARSISMGRYPEELEDQVDTYGMQLIQNLVQSIFTNGVISYYDMAKPSKKVVRRAAGQMRLVVDAKEAVLPGETEAQAITVTFPRVLLTDMVKTHRLSLMSVQSPWIVSFVPQESVVDQGQELEAQETEIEETASRQDRLRKLGRLMSKQNGGQLQRITRRALLREKLPLTRTLIVIAKDESFEFMVRYAKVLSTALRNELDAECSIHHDGDKIEIEADLYGTTNPVVKAVNAISEGVTEAFEMASGKKITTKVYPGIKSKYALIESDVMETAFRKFALQTWGN